MTNNADPDQLAKPTDLDLHCFLRQGTSVFSRTRVKRHLTGAMTLNVTYLWLVPLVDDDVTQKGR